MEGERGTSIIEAVAATGIAALLLLFLWFAASDLAPRALHAGARSEALTAALSVLERAYGGEIPCGTSSGCVVEEGGIRVAVRVRPAGSGLVLYEVEARPRGGLVMLRAEVPVYGW